MTLKKSLQAIGICALVLTGFSFLAPVQDVRADENRQLSEKSQKAIADLHALIQVRESYSKVAAKVAEDPQVRDFFTQRNVEYQKADARLDTLAMTYGIDVNSAEMDKRTKKTEEAWAKENKKIEDAKGEKAAKMALNTFITRNNEAITSLRTLRGEVKEPQIQTMINDRISALEQESTRAQQLRGMVKKSD